jgi:hypothetical protein
MCYISCLIGHFAINWMHSVAMNPALQVGETLFLGEPRKKTLKYPLFSGWGQDVAVSQ